MSVGSNIKRLRTEAGLTQKDLADKLVVSFQAVSRWENDEVEPSIETLTNLAKIFNCSVDELLGIVKEEQPTEVKVEEKVVYVESKPVLGVCHKCKNPIYDKEDYHTYKTSHRTRHGKRVHTTHNETILCSECYNKKKKEDQEQAIALEQARKERIKKKRIHSFVWGGLCSLIFIVMGIYSIIEGNFTNTASYFATAVLGFTFISTMILNNNFIMYTWLTVTSWGFVRFPGIIFSWDLDGLQFLIVMKIVFFILGILLAILAAVCATVLCMVLSIFVYPFALKKSLKYEHDN